MTALEAIIESVESLGMKYSVGYGGDILDFLEEERIPSDGIVFIQIGPEVPYKRTQDGIAKRFLSQFTVWIRKRVAPNKATEAYNQYRDLRNSLNGKGYNDGQNHLRIGEGVPAIAGGFAEPQITIEAITE